MEEEAISPEKVLLALERVLTSSVFLKSNRLSNFLRFVVKHTLQGKAGELKEYTIATQVYERRNDFDPAADTIVRTEARRLRRKLKEYYGTEGKRDAVVIAFQAGSYIPVPQLRPASRDPGSASEETVSVAVEPFEWTGDNALASECAFGISDEILHHLSSCVGICVICGSAPRAALVIQGTVRADDNLLRVTTQATTAGSQLLWSRQVDLQVEGAALFSLQEKVAAEVVTQLNSWLAGLRRLGTCRTHS